MAPKFFHAEDGLFRNAKPYIDRVPQLSAGQIIRVHNYGVNAGDEQRLVVGSNGVLYDVRTSQRVDPQKVLSGRAAEDGWAFDGFDLLSLPEDEQRKLL